MTLKIIRTHFTASLKGIYPSEEITSFFNLLSEEYLQLSRIEIALNLDKPISELEAEKFKNAILRLKKHEPVQYIIGKTEFYGLRLKVNQHTLIPRPETEELVHWILQNLESRNDPSTLENLRLLDIGTGSGCIAIALCKNLPKGRVSALDISEEALSIAAENAEANRVDIEFIQEDILAVETLPTKFDIIVSNPPYVREMEKKQMQPNVLNFEPHSALFVNDNHPLLFYKAIARLAKNHLTPNGKLFFEINEYLANQLTELLMSEGFINVELKKDIFGKDRMLKCEPFNS